MTERPVIIVGVDDSTTSGHALAWAFAEAERLGGTIKAVTTYDESEGAREQAQGIQDRLIREAVAARPVALITRLVTAGNPIDVLTLLSKRAYLLVMGRHSTSGLRHSAENSTAEQVARLAECPVTIVPGPPTQSR